MPEPAPVTRETLPRRENMGGRSASDRRDERRMIAAR